MTGVMTGLDVVLRDGLALPGEGRVGLLCNSSTLDRSYRGSPEALRDVPGVTLDRIFAPQHGFASEKQDNMIESADGVHPGTGVPILSLYGTVRKPRPEMLDGLDAILIDLQDVGTRVYTFLSTALLTLEAAGAAGVPVWILDRPNPIGGDAVEGPILEPGFASFVGMIPVPLRHGLTAAEYCRFGLAELGGSAELHVVPAEGWRRGFYYDETGLPWAMPSPNLPALETALVYPGAVLLEGTNLSEGRGTTRPFELWGAPWLDPPAIRALVERAGLAGFVLRETAFEPTFHKFRGETVRGFQIHVTDRRSFHPVAAFVAALCAIRRLRPDRFAWRETPYEYELDRAPIDLIAGTDALRLAIDGGTGAAEIATSWQEGVDRFREARRPHLIYGE